MYQAGVPTPLLRVFANRSVRNRCVAAASCYRTRARYTCVPGVSGALSGGIYAGQDSHFYTTGKF